MRERFIRFNTGQEAKPSEAFPLRCGTFSASLRAAREAGRVNPAKWKLLIGGVLIATGLGWLAYYSVTVDGAYAKDVKDYLAAPQQWQGKPLRLDGIAAKGSWQKGGDHHTFRLAEKTDLTRAVPVDFVGTMPDTFREEVMVIVAGRVAPDGVMHATEVLPQCASKYQGVRPDFYKHEGKSVVPIYSSEGAKPQANAGS